VKAETLTNGKLHSTGTYRYDSLSQRVGKTSAIEGKTEHKHFLWQGLRMLREESPGQSSLYVYEPGSYAPLARVDQNEGEEQKLCYFHTDQIGTPLEMTDADGSIVWQPTYKAWGALEKLHVGNVEQNLRFQGQYFDDETGLHYNTFRYYDPEVGRFVTQDPIGLLGGGNLYAFAPNTNGWVDPLGWCVTPKVTRGAAGQPLRATATLTAKDLGAGTATNTTSRAWARMLGKSDDDAGHIIGKLLGGSGGKNGVFPQVASVNRGQFREFEKALGQYIQANGPVDMDIVFKYAANATRPERIIYNVLQNGERIMQGRFFN
jgi:RHS repeat-associated protein